LPTKPAEDDSRECARIYENIVQFCTSSGLSFIDDSFPHSIRSIGDLSKLDRPNLKIVWLRPQDIRTKDGRRYRWAIFRDPRPEDIEQGLLGNCWSAFYIVVSDINLYHSRFVSALALIASRPELLERIFVTKEYNSYGVYQIRLCSKFFTGFT
jgi:calpain-15